MSSTRHNELAAPHFGGECTVFRERWSKADWTEFKNMVDELFVIAESLEES